MLNAGWPDQMPFALLLGKDPKYKDDETVLKGDDLEDNGWWLVFKALLVCFTLNIKTTSHLFHWESIDTRDHDEKKINPVLEK